MTISPNGPEGGRLGRTMRKENMPGNKGRNIIEQRRPVLRLSGGLVLAKLDFVAITLARRLCRYRGLRSGGGCGFMLFDRGINGRNPGAGLSQLRAKIFKSLRFKLAKLYQGRDHVRREWRARVRFCLLD